MKRYFDQLHKVEYVITYACTGKCIHCSEGEHESSGVSIDPNVAIDALGCISQSYNIDTVMTFGGEPLLYPDTVCRIHMAAHELGIQKRQIITNGYLSNNIDTVRSVAQKIADSYVNDVLVSVDAFHAECIPMKIVREFALELKHLGVPVRSQPAWLVSREHNNKYNKTTRALLQEFDELGIHQNDGNVIFPSGRAIQYLSEYFVGCDVPTDPYAEDPCRIRALSIDPDGNVLGGNIYRQKIIDIMESYRP